LWGVGWGGGAGWPDSRFLTAMVVGPGFVRLGWVSVRGSSAFGGCWFVAELDARARLAVKCRYGLTRCGHGSYHEA